MSLWLGGLGSQRRLVGLVFWAVRVTGAGSVGRVAVDGSEVGWVIGWRAENGCLVGLGCLNGLLAMAQRLV